MDSNTSKIMVITGASSGIGKCAAEILLQKGHRVFALARRLEEMRDLEKNGAIILELDLTVETSIQKCVNIIFAKEGRIDVLINNAGYGSYGAVEDVPLDEARRQFEVNLFGLARITQLILPEMRRQRAGRIINISSMGGTIYTPFGAWYHATKHALEGWSDCLRLEIKAHGIDVVVVQPGVIRTPWVEVTIKHLYATSGSGPYGETVDRFSGFLNKLYSHKRSTPPEVIGRLIAHAATTSRPRTRYARGLLAVPAMTLRRLLGDRLYDKFFIMTLNRQGGNSSPIE